MAWDISVDMHKCLASRAGADEYFALPPRPIDSLVSVIDDVVGKFKAAGVHLVPVFDGCQHPSKKTVVAQRDCKEAETWAKLREIWAKGDVDDFDACQKLKTRGGRIRPDMVQLAVKHLKDEHGINSFGAPFEAEWQCRQLERDVCSPLIFHHFRPPIPPPLLRLATHPHNL